MLVLINIISIICIRISVIMFSHISIIINSIIIMCEYDSYYYVLVVIGLSFVMRIISLIISISIVIISVFSIHIIILNI